MQRNSQCYPFGAESSDSESKHVHEDERILACLVHQIVQVAKKRRFHQVKIQCFTFKFNGFCETEGLRSLEAMIQLFPKRHPAIFAQIQVYVDLTMSDCLPSDDEIDEVNFKRYRECILKRPYNFCFCFCNCYRPIAYFRHHETDCNVNYPCAHNRKQQGNLGRIRRFFTDRRSAAFLGGVNWEIEEISTNVLQFEHRERDCRDQCNRSILFVR
jgi:hypothetical protein